MYIIIGALVMGLLSVAVMFLRRRTQGDMAKARLQEWQVYCLAFVSAPAAIAGGDGLVTHYFIAESSLSSVGLASAWAALIANGVTVAILYSIPWRTQSIVNKQGASRFAVASQLFSSENAELESALSAFRDSTPSACRTDL